MTSVKEFVVEREPTADEAGRGSFVFTDAYSVFDWGEMPDAIPEKGRTLCSMGAFNFEALEADGIATHYRGIVSEGTVTTLSSAREPSREMAIELALVPELPREGRTYDYDAYHEAAGENYVVPLEIVFRNRVPVGSSLRRRTTPADHGLDLEEWPAESLELSEPIVEFSTKYEESDRYLERSEADRIAGLADLEALESIARTVNRLVTDRAVDAGLVHEDGKIECVYYRGEIRVADVVGTFDENRFSIDGQQLSKEVLRQYYKRTQPSWVEAVAAAKAEAKRRDVADWRPLCADDPDPLPPDVVALASDLYAAGTNAYTGLALFDAPPLSAVVDRVREL